MSKLSIIMVGLPARGKSTIALRLYEGLSAEGLCVRIFNNGELRRRHLGAESSLPAFYHPDNREGRSKRERLALINVRSAKAFLREDGQVAILDATNAGRSRRAFLKEHLSEYPILFVECVNDDAELITASVQRKIRSQEFGHLREEEAGAAFMERIGYYERMYTSPEGEGAFMRVDTLRNRILAESLPYAVPYHIRIRDILVSDWVRELYLARHGESEYNVEGRIGGDAPLTPLGKRQASSLAAHFHDRRIPYIFTSGFRRSLETADPVSRSHPEAAVIAVPELDEINAGVCDGMRYADIRAAMPEEFLARSRDKYNYVYPGGEGYVTLRSRVERGFRKALFLSGGQPGIVIIGHQAINRTILSLFLFRRKEDVPYIYVPQNQYFHIVATHQKKLFELIRFKEPLI
ncbi:MAG: 6-phosphofructo-2-kinase/fructose-2,6-bisphosphatase [Desulfovibrio sp.]|jgi:broad specificity phosphatase PhoE/predicted kinase|nr:6-phosphofructo-2-kinase/fructose-2,6-bisphosphatase [Desulfovibrio sp.]